MEIEIAWQWWIVWKVLQTTWQISIICGDASESLVHHSSLVRLCGTRCFDSRPSGCISGQSIFMRMFFVFLYPLTVVLACQMDNALRKTLLLPPGGVMERSSRKEIKCAFASLIDAIGWMALLIYMLYLPEVSILACVNWAGLSKVIWNWLLSRSLDMNWWSAPLSNLQEADFEHTSVCCSLECCYQQELFGSKRSQWTHMKRTQLFENFKDYFTFFFFYVARGIASIRGIYIAVRSSQLYWLQYI